MRSVLLIIRCMGHLRYRVPPVRRLWLKSKARRGPRHIFAGVSVGVGFFAILRWGLCASRRGLAWAAIASYCASLYARSRLRRHNDILPGAFACSPPAVRFSPGGLKPFGLMHATGAGALRISVNPPRKKRRLSFLKSSHPKIENLRLVQMRGLSSPNVSRRRQCCGF